MAVFATIRNAIMERPSNETPTVAADMNGRLRDMHDAGKPLNVTGARTPSNQLGAAVFA
jgi:hypothetical protein